MSSISILSYLLHSTPFAFWIFIMCAVMWIDKGQNDSIPYFTHRVGCLYLRKSKQWKCSTSSPSSVFYLFSLFFCGIASDSIKDYHKTISMDTTWHVTIDWYLSIDEPITHFCPFGKNKFDGDIAWETPVCNHHMYVAASVTRWTRLYLLFHHCNGMWLLLSLSHLPILRLLLLLLCYTYINHNKSPRQ